MQRIGRCKCERRDIIDENELSHNITCADSLKGILTPPLIMACNQIVRGMTEDDCALVVQVVNYRGLHLALGLPGAPTGLVQGADAEASFNNFRDWLIQSAHAVAGVTPANQVGGEHSLCWHHLSDEQVENIAHGQWDCSQWAIAILLARPAIPLPFCQVMKMLGSGPAEADMYKLRKMFGD